MGGGLNSGKPWSRNFKGTTDFKEWGIGKKSGMLGHNSQSWSYTQSWWKACYRRWHEIEI